jgi:multidrug efflux system outer membrane protein
MVGVVGVAACAPVGPNYARPTVPIPPQFRFVDTPQQAASMADLPWWQVFGDPTLQALIREAIANNLDLQAAVARLERARAELGIAKSFLYPQVDATGNYTVQQNLGGEGDANNVQRGGLYGFQLSWELDLFGRIRRQTEAAYARMLASEQARRGVLVTLVGDVASTYFLLRQLDVQLDIARRTLANNDQTLALFENRLSGGLANRLEVDRIRANRAATAASIPDLEQQVALAENAMSLLLGRSPEAIPRVQLSDEALPPLIPPGLPASLLQRRPDVIQAEELLVAANADIGAARALFFPTIGLTGLLGVISGDLTSLLGGSGAVWSAGPSVVQPLFRGGRLRSNLEATQASFDEAVALYRRAALNAYREVANALVTIQTLTGVRTERETGVAALQDAADLSRARYDAGLASYLEILTADQDLFQEQQLLAQTRGAELQARAELYRALGGGWQP